MTKDDIKLLLLFAFLMAGMMVAGAVDGSAGFLIFMLICALCVLYVLYDEQKERVKDKSKMIKKSFENQMKDLEE